MTKILPWERYRPKFCHMKWQLLDFLFRRRRAAEKLKSWYINYVLHFSFLLSTSPQTTMPELLLVTCLYPFFNMAISRVLVSSKFSIPLWIIFYPPFTNYLNDILSIFYRSMHLKKKTILKLPVITWWIVYELSSSHISKLYSDILFITNNTHTHVCIVSRLCYPICSQCRVYTSNCSSRSCDSPFVFSFMAST